MQKWEYRYAWIDENSVLFIDGQFVNSKPNLSDFLDELGNDGWELCNAVGNDKVFTLIFKRPKQ